MDQTLPADIPALANLLRTEGYLADRGLATAAFIAITLGRPLLLEGEVGVGKTESNHADQGGQPKRQELAEIPDQESAPQRLLDNARSE